MTQFRKATSIGEMCEVEAQAAIADFAGELRGNPTQTEVYGLHVRTVEQTWVRFVGGLFNITTTVRGQRRIDDVANFAKYHITNPGGEGSGR